MRNAGLLALALLPWLVPSPARAEGAFHTLENDRWCGDEGDGGGNGERHCEVREATWAGSAATTDVDASPNGGIDVQGWDKPEVRLQAKVVAVAPTAGEAGDLAGQVEITTAGKIRATGPRATSGRHWWVSYRLSVPRQASLVLRSVNGGLSARDLSGALQFDTTNGGITLEALSGNVHGRTTNGGLNIRLDGTGWTGTGLDVETTNGGVNLTLPADYGAHVETATTNGSMNVDFPVTMQGRIDRKHLIFDVGKGGALVRAITTNGGVQVHKR
jgi:Putative adhesin